MDEKGFLDPSVKSIDVHFGESYLYHNNPFTAFAMHQVLYLTIIVIENSVWWVGDYIFTEMMGPVMDRFLNHYEIGFKFPSLVPGQNTEEDFYLDFR